MGIPLNNCDVHWENEIQHTSSPPKSHSWPLAILALLLAFFRFQKLFLFVGRGCPQVWTPLRDHFHYEVSVCVYAHGPTSGLRARGRKMQGGGDGARRGDGRRRLTSYFQTSWADVSRQLCFCQPLPNRMLVNCEKLLGLLRIPETWVSRVSMFIVANFLLTEIFVSTTFEY